MLNTIYWTNFSPILRIVETYKSESEVAQSCPTLCDSMDCSLSGFSRQECWSGLPFPSPGDLPNPVIEPRSPSLQADALPYAYIFYSCIFSIDYELNPVLSLNMLCLIVLRLNNDFWTLCKGNLIYISIHSEHLVNVSWFKIMHLLQLSPNCFKINTTISIWQLRNVIYRTVK